MPAYMGLTKTNGPSHSDLSALRYLLPNLLLILLRNLLVLGSDVPVVAWILYVRLLSVVDTGIHINLSDLVKGDF